MRWFQALLPREDSFFDRFEAHARLLVQGAEALRDMLNGGEGVPAAGAAIIRHEEAADEATRTVFLAVRRTFITPFDRGDILALTTSLDDAIDQMQKTAKSITLFEVSEFSAEMRELEPRPLPAPGARRGPELGGSPVRRHSSRMRGPRLSRRHG